jgi:hypothetical protein
MFILFAWLKVSFSGWLTNACNDKSFLMLNFFALPAISLELNFFTTKLLNMDEWSKVKIRQS